MIKKIFYLFLVVFLISFASAASSVSLSDQASDVRNSTGDLVNNGDLNVSIYDNLTSGNLIYSEIFINAIQNGMWNVMLGENYSNPLSLDYGTVYYKDYSINGEDIDFQDYNGTVIERKYFHSPLGELNVTSNITTTGTGFFNWIGNLVNRVTKLLVIDIDASGSVNISENLNVQGNVTFFNGNEKTYLENGEWIIDY